MQFVCLSGCGCAIKNIDGLLRFYSSYVFLYYLVLLKINITTQHPNIFISLKQAIDKFSSSNVSLWVHYKLCCYLWLLYSVWICSFNICHVVVMCKVLVGIIYIYCQSVTQQSHGKCKELSLNSFNLPFKICHLLMKCVYSTDFVFMSMFISVESTTRLWSTTVRHWC